MKQPLSKLWRLALIFTLFSVAGSGVSVYAQQPAPVKDDNLPAVDELIENITEDTEDADVDYDTYQERLNDYLQSPIRLNKADYFDLSDLGLLTEVQINGILDYREKVGKFISIYELQSVRELDLETCLRIAPFVTAGDLDNYNIPLYKLMYEGQNQIFVRWQRVLEEQAGYVSKTLSDGSVVPPAYQGSPYRLYARYRYSYGSKISYGFTAEKDPGEELFKGSQKRGFDYYSAHLYLRNIGPFKHIALGDYEIKLGQGLIAWSGLASRKGSFVMNIARNSQPVRAYTSVNENLFFRGAAATVGFGKWEATAFGSYKAVDANVSGYASVDTLLEEGDVDVGDISAGDVDEVSSLLASGFHRTRAEIADRHSLKQFVSGGSLGYKSRKVSVAINTIYARFNATLQPSVLPYSQYRFSGKELLNASVDYRYMWRNFHFFGETAVSDNGGLATLNGLLLAVDSKISFSFLQRYYQRNYQSLFAAPFAEGTQPNNENGIFIGTFIKPVRKVEISAYADVYRHPWLRFLTDAPSNGADYLLQVSYKPLRGAEMYVRYRTETKGKNLPDNLPPTDYLSNQTRASLRYHLQCKLSNTVTLKSRVEAAWYKTGNGTTEKGFMVYQDINFKPLSSPVSFNTRFALFDTDSYNARIYAYENEVLYVFSIPPYYNRGSRFYLVLRYTPLKNVDIWLRYAQTYWADQQTIGTGNELVNANHKTDVKAMLRVKF